MNLAIFDLDNTLLGGDSDHAWGTFLANKGLTDSENFRAQNDRFYADYERGQLDIHAYQAFVMSPVLHLSAAVLQQLQQEFLDQQIKPMMLPKAQALLQQHKSQGDYLLIITATNEWITRPIAQLFQVDHLIATQLAIENGRITGKIIGTPSFREGKVTRLMDWLSTTELSLANSYFYSDSSNDLPLLEQVSYPIAVDADDQLKRIAKERGWQQISLR